MRSAWGSFIADPGRGLEALGWPIYNPEGDFHTCLMEMICVNILSVSTLVEIGLDNHPSVSFVDTRNSAQRCADLLAHYTTRKTATSTLYAYNMIRLIK